MVVPVDVKQGFCSSDAEHSSLPTVAEAKATDTEITTSEEEVELFEKFEIPSPKLLKYSSSEVLAKKIADKKHLAKSLFLAAAEREDHSACIKLHSILPMIPVDFIDNSTSRLHFAIMSGDQKLVHDVLEYYKISPWMRVSNGMSALAYCASFGHEDVAVYLLRQVDENLGVCSETIDSLKSSAKQAMSAGNITIEALIQDKTIGMRRSRDIKLLQASIRSDILGQIFRLMTEGIWYDTGIADAVDIHTTKTLEMILSLEHNIANGFGVGYILGALAATKAKALDTLQLLLDNLNKQGRASEMKQVACRAFQHSLYLQDSETSSALLQNQLLDTGDALEAVSKHGDLGMIKSLFEMHTPNKFSDTALNRAFHIARKGNWDKNAVPIMELLFEKGADVNSKCEIWGSALQNAAAANDCAAVVFFISNGAVIDTPGLFGGNHSLIAAVSCGSRDTFNILSHVTKLKDSYHGVYGNMLQTASFLGKLEIVFAILGRGFNIDARLEPHGTSLMLALQRGHQNIALALIRQNADVNINIPVIGNALYFASLHGMEDITKTLVEKEADVNAVGGEFGSALQAAVARGHDIIVLFLLDSGADVNLQGGKYGNALQTAISQGHDKLAELLLLSGARVMEKPKEKVELELGVSRWMF